MIFNIFKREEPQYNNYKEIFANAQKAILNNESGKEINNILKQAIRLIETAKEEDFDDINSIACMIAGPRIRDFNSAFILWDHILKLDPLNFDALFYSVGYRIQSSDKASALRACELLIKSDYNKGVAKLKSIHKLMREGGSEFAPKQSTEEMVSDVYTFIGKYLFDNSEYDSAINAYNIAYQIDRTNFVMLRNMASVYFHKKHEYTEALKLYSQCLAALPYGSPGINEYISECNTMIAECLVRLNKIDDAKEVLRKYVKDNWSYPPDTAEKYVDEILDEIKKHK
jgi:tetratricopeptide (TPR) repeat protein